MTAILSEAAALSVAQFDTLPDTAIIRDRGVAAVLSISRNSVWRWSREGRLPRPVKLGQRVSGWRVGDVRAFLAAQG